MVDCLFNFLERNIEGFIFDCFSRVICKILTAQIEYYMVALLELFVISITIDDCRPES